MLVPYSTEVVLTRWPVANIALILVSVLLFLIAPPGAWEEYRWPMTLVLDSWRPAGLLGHMFLHRDIFHLLFNMLNLWVFGNATCEKIGRARHVLLYLAGGLGGAALHLLTQPASALVGASGAINAIVGCYLVLYPLNRVNCFWWFFRFGTVQIPGVWLVLLWLVGDTWGAVHAAGSDIAHFAHLGGLAVGFGLGVHWLLKGAARMSDFDNPTLLELVTRGRWTPAMQAPRTARCPSSRTVPPPIPSEPQSVSVQPPGRRTSLSLRCPHCNAELTIPLRLAGREFKCPHCQGRSSS